MKNVVRRKDVCAGELLKVGIAFYDEDANFISGDVSSLGGKACRGMLFVNEDGLAKDLVYTTPTMYPIADGEHKTDLDSEFVIHKYVELNELLKSLNYGVFLTQFDLRRIYNMLFTRLPFEKRHLEFLKNMNENSLDVYRNLRHVESGRPDREEPEYSRIRRI